MDVSDITKVASRKRLNEDAEKLRDKVSRETAKIIKLKVAQDTAYWDLKEKLQQVESNHERLQQNMVEVQMQHETISGQYQDELRLRPEILNKVGGTREICDVLEEYSARLKESVSRARTDRLALADTCRAAAGRVQRLTTAAQHAQHALLQRQQHVAALQHRLRTAEERQAAAVRAALEVEEARRDRLHADLSRATADIHTKERVISEMQQETQRLIAELESRIDVLEHTGAEQRAELEAVRGAEAEAREAAARAHAHCVELRTQLHTLQDALTETETCVDRLNRTVATLSENNKQLTDELRDKAQALERNDDHIQELESKLSSLSVEKESLAREVSAAEEARVRSECEHERRAAELRDLHTQEQQLREQFTKYRCESERAAETLAARAADQEAQLTAAGDTIARLMRDVQAEADARHRLELAAKGKDEELARHVALLTDIKDDNERLRAKIAGMQATIDNIQKELTGRVAAASVRGVACAERRQRPERLRADHTPTLPPTQTPTSPLDRMLFNFLSDASNEADTHDSPLSLSQVKRDLNAKSRAFFKSKRCDTKFKKHK